MLKTTVSSPAYLSTFVCNSASLQGFDSIRFPAVSRCQPFHSCIHINLCFAVIFCSSYTFAKTAQISKMTFQEYFCKFTYKSNGIGSIDNWEEHSKSRPDTGCCSSNSGHPRTHVDKFGKFFRYWRLCAPVSGRIYSWHDPCTLLFEPTDRFLGSFIRDDPVCKGQEKICGEKFGASSESEMLFCYRSQKIEWYTDTC